MRTTCTRRSNGHANLLQHTMYVGAHSGCISGAIRQHAHYRARSFVRTYKRICGRVCMWPHVAQAFLALPSYTQIKRARVRNCHAIWPGKKQRGRRWTAHETQRNLMVYVMCRTSFGRSFRIRRAIIMKRQQHTNKILWHIVRGSEDRLPER